jgi:hypothetical protein
MKWSPFLRVDWNIDNLWFAHHCPLKHIELSLSPTSNCVSLWKHAQKPHTQKYKNVAMWVCGQWKVLQVIFLNLPLLKLCWPSNFLCSPLQTKRLLVLCYQFTCSWPYSWWSCSYVLKPHFVLTFWQLW